MRTGSASTFDTATEASALLLTSSQHRIVMPYFTGQEPMVGDAVSDRDRRVGFVTHIIQFGVNPPELVIDWEDGTTGIGYFDHEALVLVERRNVSAGGITRLPRISPLL